MCVFFYVKFSIRIYIKTCTHIIFVKTTTEPKRCLCFVYKSMKYICFIFLCYILLFVHFSGQLVNIVFNYVLTVY